MKPGIHSTAPPMLRTSYKAVFIHEMDELLTIAYIFELLRHKETDSDLIPLDLLSFADKSIR
jgi:hypothetical protein